MLRSLFYMLSLLFLLSGCTVTFTSGRLAEGSKDKISRIAAFLPVKIENDSSRERIALLQKLMRNEIASKGFALIDDGVVQRVCSDTECLSGRDKLRELGAESFFSLSISSVSRANFLAGYVNNITGDLVLRDKNNQELLVVNHYEVERGGLLFNSGLAAQALISTSYNLKGDESFSRMATVFAKRIGEKLPEPTYDPAPLTAYKLTTPDFKTLPGELEQVCISSDGAGEVTLGLASGPVNLREISKGRYCSIFRSLDLNLSKLIFTLKTPIGDGARFEVDRKVVPICSQMKLGKIILASDQIDLDLKCVEEGGLRELRIYGAESELGPYMRIRSVIPKMRKEKVTLASSKGSVVAVVPVRGDGVLLKPTLLRRSK